MYYFFKLIVGIERRTSDQNSNVYNTVEYPISHTHQNIANVEAVAEEALLKYPSPQYMEIDIPENFSDENVLIGIKSSEDSLILLGNQGKILHLGSGKVTPCPTFGEGNTIGIRCWPIKGKLENAIISLLIQSQLLSTPMVHQTTYFCMVLPTLQL